MWDNKLKAVTFSFDDGVEQDKRVIEILDKYGLKGTFNLNSSKFGTHAPYQDVDKIVPRDMINYDKIGEVYHNHEIASHTLMHANLLELDDIAIKWHIEHDKETLERFCDYKVEGLAYPCGYVDSRVINVIKKNTTIRYARTIVSTYNFEVQEDLINLNPTVHITETRKAWELLKKFVNLETDKPQIFYIWGHAYEFDISSRMHWEEFEEFCEAISNKKDIFYGTNREVFLNENSKSSDN